MCDRTWTSKWFVYNNAVSWRTVVVVKGKLRLFTGLTQQERKDNIAEQGSKAFFPFSPLHAPHTVNLTLSSAEREGFIDGHTMNGLCKICVLWWSMRPYSCRRQWGMGVKCVCVCVRLGEVEFVGERERERGRLVFSSSGQSFCRCPSRGPRCLADAGVMGAFPWRLVWGGSRFKQDTKQIHSLFLNPAICNTV